jgi:hypothetical protein
MKQSGRIVIHGAGMHPYLWGRARFSVWVVSVGGGVLAEIGELWLQPFPVVTASISIWIAASTVWAVGTLLSHRNPYFPETVSAAAWRWVRRARFLNS